MTSQLLTRKQFKAKVFERDNHKCVVCGAPAVDAHHIIDRKSWLDGGYYLDNGVSLCGKHHWDAELNKILPDELRQIIGVACLLPPDLEPGFSYDKWGNRIPTE